MLFRRSIFSSVSPAPEKNTGNFAPAETTSEAYRDSHYKPETVVRPSQVYNGESYTRKTASP